MSDEGSSSQNIEHEGDENKEESENAKLEKENFELQQKIAVYREGKENMKILTANRDDDIIRLNVGGQMLSTKRSTLCQVENSNLAKAFSRPYWEHNLKHDPSGTIFIDSNPLLFGLILDYLRAKAIAKPGEYIPPPNVAEDQLPHFKNLLEYLGLDQEISPRITMPDQIFDTQCSYQVSVKEQGKVAFLISHDSRNYILGKNYYRKGIAKFKLKFASFRHSIFCGIREGSRGVPPRNQSYWNGSYGWKLGKKNEVYGNRIDGAEPTTEKALENTTLEDDTVELTLDCNAPKLSLYLPRVDQHYHIELPESATWRLHVHFRNVYDMVRIMN